ncbi:MAG: AAA family ATPase [Proteobacteria bacterium]|nr:AAA family ATPase [Pseudomonadota bacterium]
MINFKKVRFKNFGSFGNTFTEIQLDRHSMTLISGSNGHGKSFALLDSVTFGLFGRPFRKINIPQLVNSINKKNLIVEIEFEIANDSYKVIRGIRPKKFEIYKNNELLDQNAKSKDYQKMLEEQILKMNYKSFTQVVILGSSSFVPFMQLSVVDRRSVIEDILDINVFSIMNTILKSKIFTCRETQRDVKFNIEVLNEKIELLKSHISRVEKTIKEGTTENEKEITETQNKIKDHQSKIENLRKDSEKIQKEIDSCGDLKSKIRKVEVLKKQLESNKRKTEEGVLFFVLQKENKL